MHSSCAFCKLYTLRQCCKYSSHLTLWYCVWKIMLNDKGKTDSIPNTKSYVAFTDLLKYSLFKRIVFYSEFLLSFFDKLYSWKQFTTPGPCLSHLRIRKCTGFRRGSSVVGSSSFQNKPASRAESIDRSKGKNRAVVQFSQWQALSSEELDAWMEKWLGERRLWLFGNHLPLLPRK